jgi:hypothetical protein
LLDHRFEAINGDLGLDHGSVTRVVTQSYLKRGGA